jgi:hypothetical protein
MLKYNANVGRAVVMAVSRRSPTAEAQVRSWGQSRWDLWWTKWHWDRFFSPSTSVFVLSISFHWRSITRKNEKKMLIIVVTGLHNKPQGCGESVASAAGPFKKSGILPSKKEALPGLSRWNPRHREVSVLIIKLPFSELHELSDILW